ncbi:MAG TPA: bifunctional UDP-sugar hydrolase/5'-nucleotidase [Candidatus Eisenbacteria bacterium]
MTFKRFFRGLAAGLVLAAALGAAAVRPIGADEPAPDVVEIDIIYTSDIHGHIDPQEATFLNPQFPPPLGGGASAATYIRQVKEAAAREGRGFLMVDSGDLFQGTPVGMHFQGKAVIEWMNEVGYTAAALGNHDFDLGWTITEELVRTAKFPILCANLYKTGTNERVDWVQDMVITETAGVKTAIIGMVTEATAKISFAKNIDGLTFRPLDEMLPIKVEEARAKGAQLVLFPVHAGLPYKPNLAEVYRDMIEEEQRGERPREFEAMELAHYIHGVDIIFAGHSHQGYDVPWEDPVTHTLVLEPYANGSSLGHVTVKFDRRLGKMIGYDTHHDRGALVTLFEDEFWPDQGVAETIGERVAEAEKGLDETIGETRVNLQRGDADRGNLGALVADAIREFTNSDLAVQNTGGVRADIAPGEITKRHALAVLPFGNTVVEATVKGEFIQRLFEQKVGSYGPSLFISGATIEYDPTRPQGSRIHSITIGDKPLDPEATYTIAMTNFLSEGNSGMTLMREVRTEDFRFTGNTDREALERYIQAHTPINPKGESRWVRVSS